MAKYSYEFKKKVVNEYLNGEGGTVYLANKYGIDSRSQLQRWIIAYQNYGDKGLIKTKNNETYSFERKLSVVKLYLSSEISYQELALQEGIKHSTMIAEWVSRFRQSGPEGLKSRRKGRKQEVGKHVKKSSVQPSEIKEIDTSVEHVKELEHELYMLRLENAFLKEMRRLRLEDEAKMRERRGSSAVSGENSD